ncbi:MAG: DUF1501 domain-containing protein [Planctomycetota bacterium]|nr:DUF1501 domain-containing protein [Planctomycetota bacterium]
MQNTITTYRSAMKRRDFLSQLGAGGLGSVALQWMLNQERIQARTPSFSPSPENRTNLPSPHFQSRAKSIICLVMEGGPSQIDTFDPKPELERFHGTVYGRENVKTNQVKGTRYFVQSPFAFRKYGQSGLEVSDLFKEVGGCADDLAVVRSVHTDSDNHPAAIFQYNTGFPVQGNPSVGSWIVYGLGSENQSLPAFIVLRDGKPFGGTSSWNNGFLPAHFQGTQFRSGKTPILNLKSPLHLEQQRRHLDLLQSLNYRHLKTRDQLSDLDARVAAYELAFRMQTEIPDVIDLRNEPKHIHDMYGTDDDSTESFATRCLLARRFVERGVRFVQLWAGGWDSHGDVRNGHASAASKVDRPIAALLKDLKQRGLLNETLVVWGGEFGRTADTNEAQWKKKEPGRDHNPRAMTMWFAGGGTRGGTVIGSTDEVGEHAAENKFHLRDVHATMLHLMGLDQQELTHYHGGRFKRLTDNGGRIIHSILS